MYIHYRPSRIARVFLLILLWIFIVFYPLLDFRFLIEYANRRNSSPWHSLHMLNTTEWHDYFIPSLYLELVGPRIGNTFAWKRVDNWWQRCSRAKINLGKMMKPEEKNWVNVTGELSEEWVRYIGDLYTEVETGEHSNLRKTIAGMVSAIWAQEDLVMDIKGNEGKLLFRFDEEVGPEIEVEKSPTIVVDENELGTIFKIGVSHATALVREVAATLMLQDESAGDDGLEMRLYGVHWPRIGELLMTTTSEKFGGIFGLPHLTMRADRFTTSQRLLNVMIERTLRNPAWSGASNPWTASLGVNANASRPIPHCEYVAFVQMHLREPTSVDGLPNVQIGSELEKETKYSPSQISAVIFSPDCGFILESKGLGT